MCQQVGVGNCYQYSLPYSTPLLVVNAPVTTTAVETHAVPSLAQPEETGRQPIPSTQTGVHPAMSSARTEGTGVQHASSSDRPLKLIVPK